MDSNGDLEFMLYGSIVQKKPTKNEKRKGTVCDGMSTYCQYCTGETKITKEEDVKRVEERLYSTVKYVAKIKIYFTMNLTIKNQVIEVISQRYGKNLERRFSCLKVRSRRHAQLPTKNIIGGFP